MVFLGGSMLNGHMKSDFINMTKCSQYLDKEPDCRSTDTEIICRRCAYPARFGEWLQSAYPNVDVHIHNFGIGGSVSRGSLTLLAPRLKEIKTPIDIFFLHYVNNDLRGAQDEEDEVSMGYEDLIRYLLSIGAAVIDLPMHSDFLPLSFKQLVHGVLLTHQKARLSFKPIIH